MMRIAGSQMVISTTGLNSMPTVSRVSTQANTTAQKNGCRGIITAPANSTPATANNTPSTTAQAAELSCSHGKIQTRNTA